MYFSFVNQHETQKNAQYVTRTLHHLTRKPDERDFAVIISIHFFLHPPLQVLWVLKGSLLFKKGLVMDLILMNSRASYSLVILGRVICFST